MNKFNLIQFECRIQNIYNLLVNRKNLNHFFSVIFLTMCTFSYGHLFLVSIFYQPTSEKDQVHTSSLTHCRQTLQLIKFYLIKNMKGNRGN